MVMMMVRVRLRVSVSVSVRRGLLTMRGWGGASHMVQLRGRQANPDLSLLTWKKLELDLLVSSRMNAELDGAVDGRASGGRRALISGRRGTIRRLVGISLGWRRGLLCR